jgi:hypothetical protein
MAAPLLLSPPCDYQYCQNEERYCRCRDVSNPLLPAGDRFCQRIRIAVKASKRCGSDVHTVAALDAIPDCAFHQLLDLGELLRRTWGRRPLIALAFYVIVHQNSNTQALDIAWWGGRFLANFINFPISGLREP